MPESLRIVVVHGESKTLWHIVDAAAPTEEQPAILATRDSRVDAEALLVILGNRRRT